MSHLPPAKLPPAEKIRLDKWLWAARFYKTRSLACDEIDKGRVRVNAQTAKPSREIRPGDEVELRTGYETRTVVVRALSTVRGPATAAALLYEETEASRLAREAAAERRRRAPEPAQTISQGRPSKKDRRDIDAARGRAGWDARWSASIDD